MTILQDLVARALAEEEPPTCRVCGCTDYGACLTGSPPRACHWVAEDLCMQAYRQLSGGSI